MFSSFILAILTNLDYHSAIEKPGVSPRPDSKGADNSRCFLTDPVNLTRDKESRMAINSIGTGSNVPFQYFLSIPQPEESPESEFFTSERGPPVRCGSF